MTETQRRFLREIAARVGVSRVHEVRLFPTIRQGGIESGVAIVAARPPEAALNDADLGTLADVEAPIPVVPDDSSDIADTLVLGPQRYEILAARFKLIVKGTERGTWDMDVRHEADAPLDTIDRVVRGVALRAGEDGEPECLSSARLLEALSDVPYLSESDTGAEYGAS